MTHPGNTDLGANYLQAPARKGKEGAQQQAAGTEQEAYNGKVRQDIDHKAYLPAAWRVGVLQCAWRGMHGAGRHAAEGLRLASGSFPAKQLQ